MKSCVYILKDDNGLFYIGSTIDLVKRLCQHNNGHTQTTSRMKNPKLVLSQEYDSLTAARNVERRIKNLKREGIKDNIWKIKSQKF